MKALKLDKELFHLYMLLLVRVDYRLRTTKLFMDGPSGVRKGAWTREEDVLLRTCIEKYGEGKWHQVPFRSGIIAS